MQVCVSMWYGYKKCDALEGLGLPIAPNWNRPHPSCSHTRGYFIMKHLQYILEFQVDSEYIYIYIHTFNKRYGHPDGLCAKIRFPNFYVYKCIESSMILCHIHICYIYHSIPLTMINNLALSI